METKNIQKESQSVAYSVREAFLSIPKPKVLSTPITNWRNQLVVGVNPKMKIGNRTVGQGQPAFIVAELSGNHHQKYEEAVELIKAAAEAGADA